MEEKAEYGVDKGGGGCIMHKMNTNETKEISRIINRHKARLLGNLEDAGCPRVFLDAVISGYDWMRSDVQNITEGNEGVSHDRHDNTAELPI